MAVFCKAEMPEGQQARVHAMSEPVRSEFTSRKSLPIAGIADLERCALVLHDLDETAQHEHQPLARGNAEAGGDKGGIEFKVTGSAAHHASDIYSNLVFRRLD